MGLAKADVSSSCCNFFVVNMGPYDLLVCSSIASKPIDIFYIIVMLRVATIVVYI